MDSNCAANLPSLDTFRLTACSLHLIPGAHAPLERVCLGGDNLLLIYSDGRARLWDVKTREFWRSMGLDKAEELLGQGGWAEGCVLCLRNDVVFIPFL